jgi:hypothetical protein
MSFKGGKTNWARMFLEVINKQIVGKDKKSPTSLSCYLVHLYKHENLLTEEELEEYAKTLEAAEEGNTN